MKIDNLEVKEESIKVSEMTFSAKGRRRSKYEGAFKHVYAAVNALGKDDVKKYTFPTHEAARAFYWSLYKEIRKHKWPFGLSITTGVLYVYKNVEEVNPSQT